MNMKYLQNKHMPEGRHTFGVGYVAKDGFISTPSDDVARILTTFYGFKLVSAEDVQNALSSAAKLDNEQNPSDESDQDKEIENM